MFIYWFHLSVVEGPAIHLFKPNKNGEGGLKRIATSFTDIIINTEVVTSDKLNKHGTKKTFIGRIAVQTKHHHIVLTPEAVLYDTKMYPWNHDMEKHFGGNDFVINKKNHRIIIRFVF